MNLSTKSRYALRILLHVAVDSQMGSLSCGRNISSKQNINEPYLEQIMIGLKQAGFVKTVRGRNGGYKLGKKAEEITVLNIIEAIEGPLQIGGADDLISREMTAAEQVWQQMTRVLRDEIKNKTLFMIINEEMLDQSEYMI
jgi:Rrf2 family cysteine metabolism transcriptional repressor